ASGQARAGAVKFIAAKVGDAAFEARVIRAEGKQIYLNAGEESGISVGDRFGVFRSGEALIDPSTGTDLGTPDRMVGVVLVKIVRPKYAVAELVSGELPQRNDIARPENQGTRPYTP